MTNKKLREHPVETQPSPQQPLRRREPTLNRAVSYRELLAMDFSDVPPDPRLYGVWSCKDGRQVAFNRDYVPLWERYPGQPAKPASDRPRDIIGEAEYFWIDGKGTSPKGLRLMREWGIA